MTLLLTLISATGGALLFKWLRIPGGTILGAMAAAAAVSLGRGQAPEAVPEPVRTGAFIVLGASIGTTVTRETLSSMKDALVPAVVAAILLIAAGLAVALLLRGFGISPSSDLLATSPGALSVVTAAAVERGSGAPEVALFHTVRVIFVLISLPGLLLMLPDESG